MGPKTEIKEVKKNFPEDKKVFILNRMRVFNTALWNSDPLGESRRDMEWKELLKYCLSIDAPQIQCVSDVKRIWASWKASYSQKVVRKSESGAGGKKVTRKYTTADTLIYNIQHENPYHL